MSLDLFFLRLFNLKMAHPALDPLMKGASDLGKWWPALCGLALWLVWKKRKEALLVIGLGALSFMVSDLVCYRVLKPLFEKERPCHVVQEVRLLMGFCPRSPSFPSAHAANSFSLAFYLGFHFPRARVLFLGLASFVGISRIYLGVHYPSDVLGGALVGMGSSTAIRCLYLLGRRWAKRRSLRP